MSEITGIAILYALVTGFLSGVSVSALTYGACRFYQRRVEKRLLEEIKKWGLN